MEPILIAERYSHGVRLSGFTRETLGKMQGYLNTLLLKEPTKVQGNRTVMVLKKKYYGATEDGKSIFIHRNCLDPLINYLADRAVPKDRILIKEILPPTPIEANYKLFDFYKLRDYQEVIVDDIINKVKYSARVDLYTGYGKAQPLTSLIKVPGGWKLMRDIKINDPIITADGTTTIVNGVFPQGNKTVYELVLQDGRRVQACGDHLWKVFVKSNSKQFKWDVLNTTEIIKHLENVNSTVYLPLCEPELKDDVLLVTDPYVFGTSLANDQLDKYLNLDYILNEYLEASPSQKWRLVNGILDNKAVIEKCGIVSYTTDNLIHVDFIKNLIRSLGGIVDISRTNQQYKLKIRIKLPSRLFKDKIKSTSLLKYDQYTNELKLRIKSIKVLGNKVTQCISIDHPSKLYITDNYTVTHNTLSSLAALALLKCKCVVMVPPKYFGIWKEALEKTYEGFKETPRFVTISGSAELQKVINRGLENDLNDIDIFIVSNTTYRAYIDNFEKLGDKIVDIGYNVPPPRFHEVLGAGLQINDEIQEDPGLLFRIDIYTNVAKQIYLSATPFTGNTFVTKMIDVQLPYETKVRLPDYESYIDVLGLLYSDPTVKPKDYLTPFKNTYNHSRYETVMLKYPRRFDNYCKMVKRIVNGVYIKDRQPGQKCLILCATVVFIKQLVEYLKKEYPELKIGSYVSGDDYKDLLTNDITVSTIKSSGTGVDILDLRECILLQATGSKKDSIQILGRLRKLKNYPDVTPRLTYLCCNNIPHHCRYARVKKDDFMGRTKTMRMMRIN